MYQIPGGTGDPRTTGPSVAVSVRPIRISAGTGGPLGGTTAPVTMCSMVVGTAERCGNTTSTHAMLVVPAGIVAETLPAPGSVVPSASVPPASGVMSTRAVVLGTNADVAASCSSILSTWNGIGAAFVRTCSYVRCTFPSVIST